MNLETPRDRRSFLRNVGAAGLVAWSAPSIKSVPLSQAANGSPPPGGTGGEQTVGGGTITRPNVLANTSSRPTAVLAGDITRGGSVDPRVAAGGVDPRVAAGGVDPQAIAYTGLPATRFLGAALTLIAGGKVLLELARRRERLSKTV